MSRPDEGVLPPPAAGEPIRSPYLRQEHDQSRRNKIIPVYPVFTQVTPAGTIVGVQQTGFFLARTTTALTAATYSGANITAFGSGSAHLYEGTGGGAATNSDRVLTIRSVASASFASDQTVLLANIFGEAEGLFAVGRVC